MLVVDLSADFRLRDPLRLRASGTASTARRTCSARPSTGSPSSTATSIREAELVANPGCYPTATVLGAGAARRGGADRRRRRRRQVGRLRRRSRRRGSAQLRRARPRTPPPTGSGATATSPRSPRSSPRSPAARRRRSPSSPTCCRSTRASWPAATSARPATSMQPRCVSSMPPATRRSRSSRSLDRPPGVREVRDTNVCRIHVDRDARRQDPRLRRDRQPLEGRRRPGRAEPQPDARAGRARGTELTAGSGQRTADRAESARFFRSRWVDAPGGVVESSSRPRWRPGFRAAGGRLRAQADGGTDVGIVACDAAAEIGSALLLDPERRRRGAGSRLPRALRRALRSGPPSSTPATPTPRPASRATPTPSRCRSVVPRRSGSRPAAVAVAETGTIGVPLDDRRVLDGIDRAAAAAGPAGGGRLLGGDHDHRRRPEALLRQPLAA